MSETSPAPDKVSKNPEIQAQVDQRAEELSHLKRNEGKPPSEFTSQARSQIAAEIWLKKIRSYFSKKTDQAEKEKAKAVQRAETAEAETMRDNLTGLHNEKWFKEELSRKYSEVKRQGGNLWVLYVDIDLFKGINDKYGHPVGNQVLKAFGEIGSREEEPIARIGGEEFAQVISDGLELEQVQKIISRYALNFKENSKEILGEEATLSFGLARMRENDTPDTLREESDKALYYSKRNGRNRATLIDNSSESPTFKDLPLLSREELTTLQTATN